MRATALENCNTAQEKYAELKNDFLTTFSEIKSLVPENNPRTKLFIDYESIQSIPYNNEHCELTDFLLVVYKIRCNFMHGEKLRREDEPVDVALIGWANDCLGKLLSEIDFDCLGKLLSKIDFFYPRNYT